MNYIAIPSENSVRARAKEILVKRIPILGWLPNYTWGKLVQDALAGITVGLTAIPQGIAYAVVAGLPYICARPGLTIEERNIEGIDVLLVAPEQSLSFPAAEYLRERVIEWCDKRSSSIPVIIDGKCIHRIDTTVAKNLGLLHKDQHDP